MQKMLRLRYFRTLIKVFKGIRSFANGQGRDSEYYKKKYQRMCLRRIIYEWRCINARG